MMLRVSSQMTGTEVDLTAVTGAGRPDAGVAHGALLLAFTEAVMRGESAATERARLRAVLSPEEFVEVAAVIAAFNTVDRVADATGIPLDPVMQAISKGVRDQLDLARFASAANTPGN
jgi:alkylhydroperoxidase family enzyme